MPKQTKSRKPLEIYITDTAQQKIKEIVRWSYRNWGDKVAKKYLSQINNTIKSLSQGKSIIRTNKKFSSKFQYIICNKHYIFFEIQGRKLIIATLYHVNMDVQNKLNEEVNKIN